MGLGYWVAMHGQEVESSESPIGPSGESIQAFLSVCPDVGHKMKREECGLKVVSCQTSKMGPTLL